MSQSPQGLLASNGLDKPRGDWEMTIKKLASISRSQVQASEEVVWPGTSLYHWFSVPAIEEVVGQDPVKPVETHSPAMAPKERSPDAAYAARLPRRRVPPSAQVSTSAS